LIDRVTDVLWMVKVPVRVPAAAGVNVRPSAQLLGPLNVPAQVFEAMANSELVVEIVPKVVLSEP
jgi:hypothetical protein